MSRVSRGIILAVGVLALAACGGSDEPATPSGDATGTTTTEPKITAAVTSFVPGVLVCSDGDGTVTVSWTTSEASGVRFAVDGDDKGEAGTSGIEQLDVPCDGQRHRLTATPLSDQGEGRPVSRTVGPSGG